MVKERVSLSSRQLFLLVELHDNELGQMEEILDCAAGIADEMLRNRVPFSMVWWSVRNQDLVTWKVDYREQLEEGSGGFTMRSCMRNRRSEEKCTGGSMERKHSSCGSATGVTATEKL